MYADELNIENLQLRMKEDDSFDIFINNQLEIHIRRNDVGYSVDFYKYADADKIDFDNYDFDGDFISSACILDDDLLRDDEDDDVTEITVGLDRADGTDRIVYDTSWSIESENLMHGNEVVIEGVLDDNEEIITAILEHYMERVVSIEVDCEEIYNADTDDSDERY